MQYFIFGKGLCDARPRLLAGPCKSYGDARRELAARRWEGYRELQMTRSLRRSARSRPSPVATRF